jgi:hypothetical protein
MEGFKDLDQTMKLDSSIRYILRFPEAPHLYNLIQWVREFANKTMNMCNSNGYAMVSD